MSNRAAAIAVGILFLCLSNGVHSFGTGPPTSVCTELIPIGHTGTNRASDPPGGFYIYTELLNDGNAGAYNADQSYHVLLGSPSGTQFRGFLIQARDQSSGALVGSFSITDTANFQFLSCSGNAQATVVHRNNNLKTSAAFEWTAPSTAGTVEFRYTVVITNTEDYYANLNAADNRPPVSFFPTQLGEHLFSFGIPSGCSGTSCRYFVGLSPNMDDMDYLDVYLDGEAAGWIAIGFSTDMNMGNDDVLGCRVNSNMVTAVDTRNPMGRNPNVVDDDQSDLAQHFGNFENGRITCSFSRLIEGSSGEHDFNLNNSFVYLYGRRLSDQGSTTNLASHRADSINPDRSTMAFNPTIDAFTAPVVNQLCPTAPDSNATYSFQFQTPSDSYYLAARVNPSDNTYLDIRLEGNAEGWVGVGFSDEREMRNDDVFGCLHDSSGDDVFVVDTYNPSTRYAANTRDPDQSGVCPHTTSFINGRISCTFSRLIQATDEFDRDLNQHWFFFFATSSSRGSSASSLPRHTTVPDISASRANIVEDNGFTDPVVNPSCPTAPDSNAVYSFQFGTPSDSYYLAAQVNPSDNTYLDIRLEGDAEGWVGVGFSDDREMRNDDVLGCIRDATSDEVFVVDTYNPSTRYAANTRDPDQSGVCAHTTSFTNGRISCTFSRLIQATGDSDRNLNQDWFFFFATSIWRGSSLSALPRHTTVPDISASRANIVEDNGFTDSSCPTAPTASVLILILSGLVVALHLM